MTVLVTGASGFIGSHLVRALEQGGQKVRAMVRRDVEVPGAAEVVRGDLADADSLKAAAAGCEVVYHLAGAYRGTPAQLSSSHLAGTARLLRSVEPGTRFVYVSSSSVYGWHQHWPADESSPPRPASAYGSAKLAAEKLVLARTTGPSVVVRPTITYGIGDDHGMLARAHALLRRGVRRFPGTGQNRIHLTHVDDVVAGLVLVADHGEGVFLLAGPSATPVHRLFGLLAEGAGVPGPSFGGLPAGAVRTAARAVDALWSALGREGESPLSLHSVDVLTRDRAYAPQRAAAELGWEPRISVEEGVPPVGAWLAQRRRTSAAAVASGNATSGSDDELGFDWRGYVEDPDEGLGTVYERFALRDVLRDAVERTGATSVLHAPAFGMMGFPGLDGVFLARDGLRVGLLDFSEERLEAVRRQWEELGLTPELHLVESADPESWPQALDRRYDLVFSFAALWWFDRPWAVLEAQARWADKGVLCCVPNKNVFIRVREKLWHQDLMRRLNLGSLDRQALVDAGRRLGLEPAGTGLFDIPPFPDTSVPIAKVVRAALGRKQAEGEEGTWAWSILPYLKGEQPELEERIARMASWERFVPGPVAPAWAHHRYTLLVPSNL